MRLGKWIAIGVLAMPAIEIGGFIAIAALIGLLWALALTVATSLVGALILRHAGRPGLDGRNLASRQDDASSTAPPGNGLIIKVAGILLLLPGFVTDIAGGLLLIPPLRRRVGATIRRAILAVALHEERPVVDLGPDEWRRGADEDRS